MKSIRKKPSLAALTLASLALVCGALATGACAKKSGELLHYESGENGFHTRNYFYDNGKEVVVFDAQFTPELARESIAFIKSKTDSPIRYLVITHPNPDKFNGMKEFQKAGARVIASAATAAAIPGVHAYKQYYFVNMAKMFTAETYPQPGKIDVVFDGEYTIELAGGDVVRLVELGASGVSSNQTLAYVPGVDALVVGDLVHYKTHAWLEGGIVGGQPAPDLASWIDVLGRFEQAGAGAGSRVYGGRGESVALETAVAEQIAYLKKAREIVNAYLAGLEDKAELNGPAAQQHYGAIQKEFERAFPDYAHPYMIGYGVYGLVQSLAAGDPS